MTLTVILGIAVIVFAGISAQWLAWRLRLPSILLLLIFGFLIGPAFRFVNPDDLLGDLMFPLVSLAVGIILFEGGLGLRMRDLPGIRRVVRNLISIGVLSTWAVVAAAAYFVMGLDLSLSLILGAILTVSGPTVILPLLRDIRPEGRVGSILRWEGILIDPVGATLALLVFDAVLLQSSLRFVTGEAAVELLRIVIIGAALGWAGARTLAYLLKHYLIPDHLQNAFTLMWVIVIFALSDLLAGESGLLAATVMGMVLANQRAVPIKHIIEFKEDLGIILTSSIFVLLAARLQFNDILALGWPGLAFAAVVIFVARPLTVLISTLGSPLDRREKLFLAWMAPRGIVAAAVASIFAIELAHAHYPNAEKLVSLTFLIIISTVVVYGLTAGPLARRLGLARKNPQGLLLVGAHLGARALAQVLREAGFKTVLVDTNPHYVAQAQAAGLQAYRGNVLYEEFIEEIDLGRVGRMLALTPNDETNALACLHLSEVFGRANVYQLAIQSTEGEAAESVPEYLVGRVLFAPGMTYRKLNGLFEAGWRLQTLSLTAEFDFDALRRACDEQFLPLFILRNATQLIVITASGAETPQSGDKVVVLAAATCSFEAVAATEKTRRESLPE